jgi:TRAP-type C4-dicarboxylate transport system substrate-binding protein
MRSPNLPLYAVAVVLAGSSPALTQETVIRTAMFIPSPLSVFRATFDRFVERVNEEGKGSLKIANVVSEESIPGMQMATALRNGVVDMIAVPPSYYFGVMPEGEATPLSEFSSPEMRKRGWTDLMQPVYAQKMNAHFLAQYGAGVRFHVFLNKKVATIEDFKPLRMRTTPSYRPFFNKLVSGQIQTSRGEVYTALERGVVDGYANVISEVKPAGWDKVSKFRVDPGFYSAVVHVLLNKPFWDGLKPEQRAALERAGKALEEELEPKMVEADKAAGKVLEAGGMQIITLDADNARRYVKLAYDAHWDELMPKLGERGAKIRQILTK